MKYLMRAYWRWRKNRLVRRGLTLRQAWQRHRKVMVKWMCWEIECKSPDEKEAIDKAMGLDPTPRFGS